MSDNNINKNIINKNVFIKNVKFDNILLNAAGCRCTTKEELYKLYDSKSAGIVTKSCTLEYRDGNDKPRYYDNNVLSINSTGLANNGYKFYSDIACEFKNKPYIMSVAGINKGDNVQIIKNIQDNNCIDFIELNLSCPNIIGKPQIGYDFEACEELFRTIFEFNEINLGIKLPPYFDIIHFEIISDIIKEYDISYVTCINSLGNGLIYDNNKPAIKPKNGLGGIGGSVIKPFGLSNVYNFNKLLNIPIIGCGGITCKQDIYEYLLSGATMVQIGTQLMKEDVGIFSKLIN